eukprot:898985_1
MIKLIFIFAMLMFAVLFSLWFITGTEEDTCGLWNDGMAGGLLHIFEVFMGTKPISAFEDLDSLSMIYLVIASFFGSVCLFNLLIALMISNYESMKAQAEADVILNKTKLSFDLLHRSRHMPPPLNIVLYVIAFVVWTLNFLFAFVYPKCNIFQFMHHDLFDKMRTKTLCCDSCVADYNDDGMVIRFEINRFKYFESMNRCQVLKWHSIEVINIILQVSEIVLRVINMIANLFLLIVTCGQCVWRYNPCLRQWRWRKICRQRMLHKGCYGQMKRFSREYNLDPVDGIT